MDCRELPDPELLRKLLRYEPETGKLFWNHRPLEMFGKKRIWATWNTRWAGREAFTSTDGHGYQQGQLLSRRMHAHRVIWAVMTGRWPTGQIDHINGVRNDNRLLNLREVSVSENRKNQRRRLNNTSGVTGVSWAHDKQKWLADIRVDGKQIYIGRFDDFEDAVAARKAAEKTYGFHPNHGRAA
jgi:hypothetical protein